MVKITEKNETKAEDYLNKALSYRIIKDGKPAIDGRFILEYNTMIYLINPLIDIKGFAKHDITKKK